MKQSMLACVLATSCMGYDVPVTAPDNLATQCGALPMPCQCYFPLGTVQLYESSMAALKKHYAPPPGQKPDFQLATAACPNGVGVFTWSGGFTAETWFFNASGQLIGRTTWSDAMPSGCPTYVFGAVDPCPEADRRWDLDPAFTVKTALDPALTATVTAEVLLAENCTTAVDVWTGNVCAPNVMLRTYNNSYEIWLFDAAGKLQTLMERNPAGMASGVHGPVPNCLTNPSIWGELTTAPQVHVCHDKQKL